MISLLIELSEIRRKDVAFNFSINNNIGITIGNAKIENTVLLLSDLTESKAIKLKQKLTPKDPLRTEMKKIPKSLMPTPVKNVIEHINNMDRITNKIQLYMAFAINSSNGL